MVMKTDAQYRIRKILLVEYISNRLMLDEKEQAELESIIDREISEFIGKIGV